MQFVINLLSARQFCLLVEYFQRAIINLYRFAQITQNNQILHHHHRQIRPYF